MLAHLFDIQPEAVALYHFVRSWFKSQGFNGLKGYTLCLLVLFYLQSKMLMPTVATVQNGLQQKCINGKYLTSLRRSCIIKHKPQISGWNTSFNPNRTLTDYHAVKIDDYKDQIHGFFKFYEDFNFNQVMSPNSGQVYPKIAYILKYRSFKDKGLNIAGPINQASNCGAKEIVKDQFVSICKETSGFFRKNYYVA